MIYVFVAICLFGSALAQVPSIGSCPDVKIMQDFDISRYMGRWYEAERYFAAFEIGAKCVTADYSIGENGTVKVVNSQISEITGKPSSIEGTARVPNASEPARLKVKFSSVPFGIEGNYWVLDTDYDSYSIVFSCTNLEILNLQFAWFLTREQNPSDDVIAKGNAVIEKNKISRSTFSKTNQTDCPSS